MTTYTSNIQISKNYSTASIWHTNPANCQPYSDESIRLDEDVERADGQAHSFKDHLDYDKNVESLCISAEDTREDIFRPEGSEAGRTRQQLRELEADPFQGGQEIGPDLGTQFTNAFSILNYIAILFAVICVMLIGFYMKMSVFGNDSAGMAKTVRKILPIFIGLALIFSAPTIVGLAFL